MSTRCCIEIKQACKSSEEANTEVKSVILYHHHDGYPQGVGYDLYTRLQKYPKFWYMDDIANDLIKDTEDEYEYTIGLHTDIDYLYVIDCSAKTLKCYRCAWGAKIDKEVPMNFEKEAL